MASEEKILKLLAFGVAPTDVAAAAGVTPGYVSQLCGREDFATKLMVAKLEQLQGASERDEKYDSLEDELLAKLKQSLPLMFKPREILSAINVVNGAKRRGVAAGKADTDFTGAQLVRLTVAPTVVNQFICNSNNEVVEVAGRALNTIGARELLRRMAERGASTVEVVENAEVRTFEGTVLEGALETEVAANG